MVALLTGIAFLILALPFGAAAADSGWHRHFFGENVVEAPIVATVDLGAGEITASGGPRDGVWQHRILELYNQDWRDFRVRFDNDTGAIVFAAADKTDDGHLLRSGSRTALVASGTSWNIIGDIDYTSSLGDGGPSFFTGPVARLPLNPPGPARLYLLPEAANGLMATSVAIESGDRITTRLLTPFAKRQADAIPPGFNMAHDPSIAVSIPEGGYGESSRPAFDRSDVPSSIRHRLMGPPRPGPKDPAKAMTPITRAFGPPPPTSLAKAFIEIANFDCIPYAIAIDAETSTMTFARAGDQAPEQEVVIVQPGSIVALPTEYVTWTLLGDSGKTTAVTVRTHPITAVNILPDYAEGKFGMRAQATGEQAIDGVMLLSRRQRSADEWPDGYDPANYPGSGIERPERELARTIFRFDLPAKPVVDTVPFSPTDHSGKAVIEFANADWIDFLVDVDEAAGTIKFSRADRPGATGRRLPSGARLRVAAPAGQDFSWSVTGETGVETTMIPADGERRFTLAPVARDDALCTVLRVDRKTDWLVMGLTPFEARDAKDSPAGFGK